MDYYARAARIRESRIEIAALEERIRDEVLGEITESRAARAAQDAELVKWLMNWTTATRADLQAMADLTEEFRELAASEFEFIAVDPGDEGQSN